MEAESARSLARHSRATLRRCTDALSVAVQASSTAFGDPSKFPDREIHELVADHFQYRNGYSTSISTNQHLNMVYEGPWQDRCKDIDPSGTLSQKVSRSTWNAHASVWWCVAEHGQWGAENAVALCRA